MIKFIKNNKIKFILIILFILYIFCKIINYIFFDTVFELINHSNKDYYYYNIHADYGRAVDDVSEAEEYSFQARYTINSSEKKYIKLSSIYFNTDKIILAFDFFIDYPNKYTDMDVYFQSQPKYPNQKSYCSFKIEIYQDKTIVTPTNKRFCKKPIYYYGSFNPYKIYYNIE